MNNKMKWLGIFALAASLLLTACRSSAHIDARADRRRGTDRDA